MSSENKIGILAYGSLIDYPGDEIESLIEKKIICKTPFKIEYARMSKSRDYAPTLIPVTEGGETVNAVILVLKDSLQLSDAKNFLWRRETRQPDKTKVYVENLSPDQNTVQVKVLENFESVENVLYTSIASNIGVNSPSILADLAIKSILDEAGEKKLDGVRYLLNAKRNGISTPLSHDYETAILKYCQVNSLEEAIDLLDSKRPANLKKKSELKKFETQVLEIADLSCQYGIDKTRDGKVINSTNINDFLKENKDAFVKNCHDGFKQAQNKILVLLLEFEKERDKLNIELGQINKKSDSLKYLKIKNDISGLDEKEHILRHLIDTIAWQMISGQVHIARRLYQGVHGKKRLLKSNIESVIKVAEELNKNEGDFALISDLSSYIQIGDLLLKKSDGSVTYVEVKEGVKNREILNMMNKIIYSPTPIPEVMEELNLDKKSAKQLDRNLKQYSEMLNLSDILNNDKGWDKSGKPFKLVTPKEDIPRFMKELFGLYSQLQTRNLLAYEVIDDCLHIGMFKGPLRFLGPTILKSMCGGDSENFVSINFLNVTKTLYKPLFVLPFPKGFLFDILFGRVNIYFALDIDTYLSLFSKYEMKAEWLSRKETMKVMENKKNSGVFIHKNRAIKITDNIGGAVGYLAHGTFQKIFFEHIFPSYTAYSFRYLLDEELSE